MTRSATGFVFAENSRLFEHGVDEGRLAVINVRNDSDVPDIGGVLLHAVLT